MENLVNIEDEFILEPERKAPVQNKVTVFDAKNYLNVKLAANEDKKVLKIRILPIDKDTPKPFKTIFMHTVKLTPEQQGKNPSEWKSFVCLKRTDDVDHEKLGDKCPFCEMNEKAYKAYTTASEAEKPYYKEIFKSYFPSEFGIIRCIERGHEEDGPKFWKFAVRQDGKDPMNTIRRLYTSAREESIEEGETPLNILDINDGKDLKITIEAVYDKAGQRTKKTSISIEVYGKRKPLSEDTAEMVKWVTDSKKWSDVFVAKPYDYLSLIADKKVPFYDKANNMWCAMTGGTQTVKVDQQKLSESNNKIENAEREAINMSFGRDNNSIVANGSQPVSHPIVLDEDIPF